MGSFFGGIGFSIVVAGGVYHVVRVCLCVCLCVSVSVCVLVPLFSLSLSLSLSGVCVCMWVDVWVTFAREWQERRQRP